MKKYRFLLLGLIVFMVFTNSFVQVTFAATASPPLNSEGVVLMDANTGQVVFSKNPDTKYYPASTTKILTALIVLENSKLDENVTVGEKPPFVDGTSIGLKEGEIFTVKELLSGLLLESGNDCAETLAEHISGSTEEFAILMNKRAKSLGALNSNFKNPSGLPDEEHYTTPRDLALIMKACTNNPDFVAISKTPRLDLQPSTLDGVVRKINNHNLILLNESKYYYKFSVASKKGYTIAAKFTNVISATKNGKTYVASFLKGEGITQVYKDVADLFDYGFDNFEDRKIYSEGDEVGSFNVDDGTSIPLLVSQDIYYTVPIGGETNLKPLVEFDPPTEFGNKDLKRGDKITQGIVTIDGDLIKSIDLVSGINKPYAENKTISTSFIENNKYIIGICVALMLLVFARIMKVKKIRMNKFKKFKK